MNKPASVITTLILFGIFIAIGLLPLFVKPIESLTAILLQLIFPFLYFIGWVGVFARKNWARIYSAVLIVLFGIIGLILPFVTKSKEPMQFLMLSSIMFIFFLWWSYSLAFRQPAKEYFK